MKDRFDSIVVAIINSSEGIDLDHINKNKKKHTEKYQKKMIMQKKIQIIM